MRTLFPMCASAIAVAGCISHRPTDFGQTPVRSAGVFYTLREIPVHSATLETDPLVYSLPQTSWLAIDPYTVNCEFVKVAGIDDRHIRISPVTQRVHKQHAPVIALERGEVTPQLFGATANGTGNNDTIAIQEAVDAPAAAVVFPPGHYVVDRTITITRAKLLRGVGIRGAGFVGSIAPLSTGAAIIDRAFANANADLFTVSGAPSNVDGGAGGGFENLTIRQVSGTGQGSQGVAIRYVASSSRYWSTWNKIRDVNIEVFPGRDDWSYGIVLDGTATRGAVDGEGQRDTWIENIRVFSGPHAHGSLLAMTVGGLYIANSLFNGPNSILTISGPSTSEKPSAQVRLEGNMAHTLHLDSVNQVIDRGGIYEKLVATSRANQLDLQVASLSFNPQFDARNSLLSVGVFLPTGKPTLWASNGEELHTPTFAFRTGTPVAIGTADDNPLRLMTNGSERVRIETSGDITILSGDLVLGGSGNGLSVKEGPNATLGIVALKNGSANVQTTRVATNTRIFLTTQNGGANVGTPFISDRKPRESFTIKSTNAKDTSSVAWLLLDPS